MLRHTLVGYDGSDTARRAFRLAVELMRATGGRVRVVSAVQIAEGGPESCALMMTDAGMRRQEALLRELLGVMPGAADITDVEVIHGSPGDVLLAQVEAHAIDHIVIGHTERGALLRWLVGSVSTDIIGRAPVPVTVVP